LILMKIGGRIIYSGPLGQRSSKVIEYFEVSCFTILLFLMPFSFGWNASGN
jgi:hypothetical protein